MEPIYIATSLMKFGPKIAEYLQLIEGTDKKLDRIAGMHLKSAFENLRSAQNADLASALDYTKRARDKFIDAISIERDDVKLFHAHCGLAFCQRLLNDPDNMTRNLQKAYEIFVNKVQQESQKTESFKNRMPLLLPTLINPIALGYTAKKLYDMNSVSADVQAMLPLAKEIEDSGAIKIEIEDTTDGI